MNYLSTFRRAALLITFAFVAPAPASAQDPLSFHTRHMYAGVKTLLLRSAEKMPEENYSFRPVETVRTFGQIIGHAADSQYMYCAIVLGEKPPMPANEKTKTTKADLIAGLKDALAYCDRAYDTMTDAAGAQMMKLHTHEMPKLGLLSINNIHSTEHYGNIITYLRIKNIIPPSSEPGFTVPLPKK